MVGVVGALCIVSFPLKECEGKQVRGVGLQGVAGGSVLCMGCTGQAVQEVCLHTRCSAGAATWGGHLLLRLLEGGALVPPKGGSCRSLH